jgi:hypothetical protein
MATWRDRVKTKGNATRTKDDTYTPPVKMKGNPTRTKDDEVKPPTKTVADAAQKWKEKKAPPLLPIHPTVGPTQTAKQAAGVRYKFTPEAQKMLHESPISMRPLRPDDDRGGEYTGDAININMVPGSENSDVPRVLAHEFAHKWFNERQSPEEQQAYLGNHNRWANEGGPQGIAQQATEHFYRDHAMFPNLYANDSMFRPTETYARVMEQANNMHPQDIPGYMQPAYRGLLQGVPNPRPVQNPDPMSRSQWKPDESGNYGSPPPVKQWRNYW